MLGADIHRCLTSRRAVCAISVSLSALLPSRHFYRQGGSRSPGPAIRLQFPSTVYSIPTLWHNSPHGFCHCQSKFGLHKFFFGSRWYRLCISSPLHRYSTYKQQLSYWCKRIETARSRARTQAHRIGSRGLSPASRGVRNSASDCPLSLAFRYSNLPVGRPSRSCSLCILKLPTRALRSLHSPLTFDSHISQAL